MIILREVQALCQVSILLNEGIVQFCTTLVLLETLSSSLNHPLL